MLAETLNILHYLLGECEKKNQEIASLQAANARLSAENESLRKRQVPPAAQWN